MSDEVVPVWDSIRNTCKRWGGIHRNTFLNKYRDRVDTRRLGKKIIVKQSASAPCRRSWSPARPARSRRKRTSSAAPNSSVDAAE